MNEISFKVEHYYHKPIRWSKEPLDPRLFELQKILDEEKRFFVESLKKLEVSCGFLNLLTVVDVNDDTCSMFPLIPQSAQCKIKAQVIQECLLPPSLEMVLSYGEKFVELIHSDDEQRRTVEKSTRR